MTHTLQVDCPGIPMHIWHTSVGCLFTCWLITSVYPKWLRKKAGNNTVGEFSPTYCKLYTRLLYTDKPIQNSINDFSAILVSICRLKNIPQELKFTKVFSIPIHAEIHPASSGHSCRIDFINNWHYTFAKVLREFTE